jgi:RimJ/RimL family protein N-acetyltransferase
MVDAIFATDRLMVRNFRPDDLDAVTGMWSDPVNCEFMDEGPMLPEQCRIWLEDVIYHNAVRPRSAYNLAITLLDESRAIGWIGYGPSGRSPLDGRYGVGYLLDRAYWGRGYLTEVLRGVLGHVFGALGGKVLSAWCYTENAASVRVLEKAGFALVHEGPCGRNATRRCAWFEAQAG